MGELGVRKEVMSSLHLQLTGTWWSCALTSGGKLPNLGFVVFDDSEPVQKVLSNRPIMFRGTVRLNVEEKKTRAAREGDRRDNRLRGPGGPVVGQVVG